MELLLVVAGGAIGILAGPVTEWAKHHFGRKQAREERARTFQRDTLLALARHLTDASIAAKLASLAHEAAGYPETFQNDNIAIFEEHIIEARHREFFVDDEQVRTLSGETIRAAADLITIKDKESADAKSKEAADLYIRVGNRIGELVRKH